MLDDPAAVRSADPQGLIAAYLSVGGQLREAYPVAAGTAVDASGIRSVLFCGMGGSAAAADVVAAAGEGDAPVGVQVRRGYRLPDSVGRDTLVVSLSYSGDTEETLAAHGEAVERGARTVAISAGGALAEPAAARGTTHVPVPPGAPQPRAALGWLTGAALGVLVAAGVVEDATSAVEEAAQALDALAAELAPGSPAERNRARSAAERIGGRIPVVWGSEGVSEPAAWRWKCAFNENAKIPAFASALPELAHHEVAGWTKGHGDAFALVVLREAGEHPSVGPRVEAAIEEVRAADVYVLEVRADGSSPLARAMSLMTVGDLASAYHAVARGVDPAPIDAIARVKRRLAG